MEFMSPDFLRETFKNLKNQEIDIEKIESNYVIAKFDSENFKSLKSIIESLGFG